MHAVLLRLLSAVGLSLLVATTSFGQIGLELVRDPNDADTYGFVYAGAQDSGLAATEWWEEWFDFYHRNLVDIGAVAFHGGAQCVSSAVGGTYEQESPGFGIGGIHSASWSGAGGDNDYEKTDIDSYLSTPGQRWTIEDPEDIWDDEEPVPIWGQFEILGTQTEAAEQTILEVNFSASVGGVTLIEIVDGDVVLPGGGCCSCCCCCSETGFIVTISEFSMSETEAVICVNFQGPTYEGAEIEVTYNIGVDANDTRGYGGGAFSGASLVEWTYFCLLGEPD